MVPPNPALTAGIQCIPAQPEGQTDGDAGLISKKTGIKMIKANIDTKSQQKSEDYLPDLDRSGSLH
jgi:hypothetical protein